MFAKNIVEKNIIENKNNFIVTLTNNIQHILDSIDKLATDNDLEDLFIPLKEDVQQVLIAIEKLGADFKPLSFISENNVDAMDIIKKYPVIAVTLAGGLGFLLARLISR